MARDARGTLDGEPAVIAAIEPAFQGGSIGEVSGAKIAAALEMALSEIEAGRAIRPVVLFETGGMRLQEAGVEELDAGDRRLIWSMICGEERVAVGLADSLVDDDIDHVRHTVLAAFARGVPRQHRTENVDGFIARLAQVNPDAIDPDTLRNLWSTS